VFYFYKRYALYASDYHIIWNTPFVGPLLLPFDGFWGMWGENSCNVFLLLFMVLWVHIFATLCRRAVLMLWRAFLCLGLRPVGFFPPFAFMLGGFHSFFFYVLQGVELILLISLLSRMVAKFT
jgi:hypothetical protein